MVSVKVKSALVFAIGVIVLHVLTYYFAGIIAQVVLNARQYYPPSPNAISFLRDPLSTYVQVRIVPAQVLRGVLFAIALYPFRRRIIELGQYYGGLAVTGVTFLFGWVAGGGGMIEHYVYYVPIPSGFVLISFVEILLQTLLFGQLLLLWEKRFNRAFYADQFC
jgi:hypothetical protein